jgi:hypothetical protein
MKKQIQKLKVKPQIEQTVQMLVQTVNELIEAHNSSLSPKEEECPVGKELHEEYMRDGHCSHCKKSSPTPDIEVEDARNSRNFKSSNGEEVTMHLFHLFHKWEKWEDLEEGDIVRGITERVVGRYFIQKRVCSVCGDKDLRRKVFYK